MTVSLSNVSRAPDSEGRQARTRGVQILIELLRPLRAPAMIDPRGLLRLVEALAAPDVAGVAFDLGHLADGRVDADGLLASWPAGVAAVEELQLRGPRSTPAAREFPLARTLDRLSELPAVVCVEHREPIPHERFTSLVTHLRAELETLGA